jgi:hypothetical protein
MKPRLFLGSSSESKPRLEFLARALSDDFEVTPWYAPGVFRAGDHVLARLQHRAFDCELALFLFDPEDKLSSRGVEYYAPRDNVLLELGLFLTRLGGGRCFFVVPADYPSFKTPSDLHGVVSLRYDVAGPVDDSMAEVASQVIACLAPEPDSLSGRWLQHWNVEGSVTYPGEQSEADVLHVGNVVTAFWPGEPDRFALYGTYADSYITGTWRDVRGGFAYRGSFQLRAHPSLRTMKGRWVGVAHDDFEIRQGKWTWDKLS